MVAWLLGAVVGLIALRMGGDLVYSLVMKRGYTRWDHSIEREPDGVRRGCREYSIGSGNTAILLVHGFGDSPAVYQRLAPALADKGFACRVMRLPGCAMPMAEYCKTSGAQWREQVATELLALRQSHSRVVVVAHSLGAAVVREALAEHADMADGVVLLAPLIDVCNRRSPLLPARAWYHILDSLLLFTDRIGMVFPPDLKDPATRALMKEDRYVPRVVYREMFALLRRNQARVATFRLPLLMVLGRDDLIVDNDAAVRFYRDCGAVSKQLIIAEEAGHMLPLDRGWEQRVEEIAAFISGLPKKSGPGT
jgi:carboxylesterase